MDQHMSTRHTGLPPPGGESTSQADEYACHTMAPQAIIHNLSVHPPSPFLTASMGPGCYNLLLKRDRLCVFAALSSNFRPYP
jgi:hypothetical protein